MSKNVNNMFGMISNVQMHDDVSNLRCLIHFQYWKQTFKNISSFQLDFMLFLTSKLLKNVNFSALGHFGQHLRILLFRRGSGACVIYLFSMISIFCSRFDMNLIEKALESWWSILSHSERIFSKLDPFL